MTANIDGRPPYICVADELRRDIANGRYKVGEQLPGAPVLERRFSIAPMTLRNAMRLLREEGLIYTQQGRGTFVRSTPDDSADHSAPLDMAEEIEHLRKELAGALKRIETLERLLSVRGT